MRSSHEALSTYAALALLIARGGLIVVSRCRQIHLLGIWVMPNLFISWRQGPRDRDSAKRTVSTAESIFVLSRCAGCTVHFLWRMISGLAFNTKGEMVAV